MLTERSTSIILHKKNPMLTVNNQIDDKNIRWVIQVSPLKWQGIKYIEDSQFS